MSLLISVEGGEYTGKSSFIAPYVCAIVKCLGFKTLLSREPGGTPQAEKIRREIFRLQNHNTDPYRLAVLFNKARRLHLNQLIIPAMGKKKEKNIIVVLDRYLDSTRIYQGIEGKIPLSKIKMLEKKYVGHWFPDLTFILYLNPKKFHRIMRYRINQNQKNKKRDLTEWDKQKIEQHLQRQQNYLSLVKIAKDKGEKRLFCLVDVSGNPKEIVENIRSAVLELLAQKKIKPARNPVKLRQCMDRFLSGRIFLKITDLWSKQEKHLSNIDKINIC